ncbi:hypothetical protein H6P81_013252 [Aristolochia fimbriata]|uniref:PA domain-containing protein n=1 Tax=Aristolochia fimbriata TaxID=158543 RepID=A0AAV7EEK7_ARIFI|nr:hypothetical protein H6P81_013252 [Aristolochia fimbriata]
MKVKVKNWVDGVEKESVDGLSARFGAVLLSSINEALRLPAVMANPPDYYAESTSKLSNSIAFAERGECAFTAKAEFAQLGGVAGLLVINDSEGSHVDI